VAKVAKDKSATIAEKQAAVAGYLAQLPALLDAVRALLPQNGSPASKSGAASGKEAFHSMGSFVPPAQQRQSTSRSQALENNVHGLVASSNALSRVADRFDSREEVQHGH
jgi:histone deacetylase complex regulatory component SIN3